MSVLDKIGPAALKWATPKFFLDKAAWRKFFEWEIHTLSIWTAIILLFGVIFDSSTRTTVFRTILMIFLRRVFAGGICTSTKRLDGQNIIVTGSNVGIGKETALDLSARGANIIMACRNTKAAEKTADFIKKKTDGKVEVLQMDLSSLASIREFVEAVKSKYTSIHQLINNAGIMRSPQSKTTDGFDITIGTNHVGTFYLTQLLMPLLRHADQARIINLASLAHQSGKMDLDNFNYEKGTYNKSLVYGTSKLANILFTRQLAKEIKGSNIQVFSVHPGVVKSELGRHLPYPFSVFYGYGMQLIFKDTVQGAQTTLYCATDAQQDELMYFADCEVGNPSPAARDDNDALQLWKFTEKLVKDA